jgi:hypothetical protein
LPAIGEKLSLELHFGTGNFTVSIALPAGRSAFIARGLEQFRGLNTWDTARLLTLVNLAMADGFIAGFETKYRFNFWRPVTAIRAGDTDGNDATIADPKWSSFLNTPALPDYTCTHSILGGAASEVLRRFFGDDHRMFTTTSGPPFPRYHPLLHQLFPGGRGERRVAHIRRHPLQFRRRGRDRTGEEHRRAHVHARLYVHLSRARTTARATARGCGKKNLGQKKKGSICYEETTIPQ